MALQAMGLVQGVPRQSQETSVRSCCCQSVRAQYCIVSEDVALASQVMGLVQGIPRQSQETSVRSCCCQSVRAQYCMTFGDLTVALQVMGLVQGVPRQSQETSWTALMRDAVASMPATSTPVQAAQPRPAGLPLSQPPAWRASSHPPPVPVSQHSESHHSLVARRSGSSRAGRCHQVRSQKEMVVPRNTSALSPHDMLWRSLSMFLGQWKDRCILI